MNDFDEKIISMWSSTLENYRQIYCFIHLERNAKKRSLNKDDKVIILEDIQYLAESLSQDEFDTRWKLTKEAWKEMDKTEVNNFLDYFESQYVTKHKNWFIGICPVGLGNSNNAIEGFNCTLKRRFTNYERQDIVSYFKVLVFNSVGSFLKYNEADDFLHKLCSRRRRTRRSLRLLILPSLGFSSRTCAKSYL